MVRGKLGIQSEAAPAMTDILSLQSPGSLCLLTYLVFLSESPADVTFADHLPHRVAIIATMQLLNAFTAPQ